MLDCLVEDDNKKNGHDDADKVMTRAHQDGSKCFKEPFQMEIPTLTTFKCLALVFIYLWPGFRRELSDLAIYKLLRKIMSWEASQR